MSWHALRRSAFLRALALAALVGFALLGRAFADGVTPRTITRNLEPVVVTGADLPLLQGSPADSLFVYAFHEGNWEQVPFQVDHVVSGVYTSTVGGSLGPTDEIVFMASDLGDNPPLVDLTASLPISTTWYEIEATDSLSPTLKGWAYVVRSSGLTKTFTETYAAFDGLTTQITTTNYALGFASSYPGFDYLALNGSGVDILDRTKIRVHLTPPLGTLTEEQIPAVPLGLTKNGPVRVIIAGGGIIGYRSVLHSAVRYSLPQLVAAARFSTDFSASAVPSMFYNANTPAGEPIDGSPDVIGATPLSPWWQATGATGTLVEIADASLVGGIQTNYYKDEATIVDHSDTGDRKSYGDTGIRVDSPNPTVVYRSALFMLPPGLPNVGAMYAAYFAHPLQITVVAQSEPGRVYLPIVIRS
jgi:hypothetical protein